MLCKRLPLTIKINILRMATSIKIDANDLNGRSFVTIKIGPKSIRAIFTMRHV